MKHRKFDLESELRTGRAAPRGEFTEALVDEVRKQRTGPVADDPRRPRTRTVGVDRCRARLLWRHWLRVLLGLACRKEADEAARAVREDVGGSRAVRALHTAGKAEAHDWDQRDVPDGRCRRYRSRCSAGSASQVGTAAVHRPGTVGAAGVWAGHCLDRARSADAGPASRRDALASTGLPAAAGGGDYRARPRCVNPRRSPDAGPLESSGWLPASSSAFGTGRRSSRTAASGR